MHRQTTTLTATEITRTGFSTKTCSDRSIDLCVLRDASIELFCVLRDYESGTQDAEVTNSMQISESAVRPSLQFFSLSEKCRMMNICRCQDKGGTFSSVILSHWVLHLHCLVSSPYSAPDSNPPSVAQKFDTQPVYLTSQQIKAFSWLNFELRCP